MRLCPICNQVLRSTIVDGAPRYYCPHCKRPVLGLTKAGRAAIAAWGGGLVCASACMLSITTATVPLIGAFALGIIGAGMISLAVHGE